MNQVGNCLSMDRSWGALLPPGPGDRELRGGNTKQEERLRGWDGAEWRTYAHTHKYAHTLTHTHMLTHTCTRANPNTPSLPLGQDFGAEEQLRAAVE